MKPTLEEVCFNAPYQSDDALLGFIGLMALPSEDASRILGILQRDAGGNYYYGPSSARFDDPPLPLSASSMELMLNPPHSFKRIVIANKVGWNMDFRVGKMAYRILAMMAIDRLEFTGVCNSMDQRVHENTPVATFYPNFVRVMQKPPPEVARAHELRTRPMTLVMREHASVLLNTPVPSWLHIEELAP